jgi:hypothetical protein
MDSMSGRATSAETVDLTVGFNVSVKAANGITKARLNMRFNSVPAGVNEAAVYRGITPRRQDFR